MNRTITEIISAFIIFALGVTVGFYKGYKSYETRDMPINKPPVTQSDGSVIIQVKTDTIIKTVNQIPKGYTLNGNGKIIIVDTFTTPPTIITVRDTFVICPPCPQCTTEVNLTMVSKDGLRRIIASSPSGLVVSAIDVPIESEKVFKEIPWAAGLRYNHGILNTDQLFSIYIQRDLGPFRVGAEYGSDGTTMNVGADIGIRF